MHFMGDGSVFGHIFREDCPVDEQKTARSMRSTFFTARPQATSGGMADTAGTRIRRHDFFDQTSRSMRTLKISGKSENLNLLRFALIFD